MSDLLRFLIQIITIVAVARVFGTLLARWRQSPVIGEILAGIFLGPSVLGWLAPDVSATLFPAPSLPLLNHISQLGLVLFKFLVGLQLDIHHLRLHRTKAVWISVKSIAVPLCGGIGLAALIHARLAPPHTGFWPFALLAAMTEWIGIHAVFGAFFAGVLMPKEERFVKEIAAAFQPVTTLLLLPIFFAYTGLRMTAPTVSTELLLDIAAIGRCCREGRRRDAGCADCRDVLARVGVELGL